MLSSIHDTYFPRFSRALHPVLLLTLALLFGSPQARADMMIEGDLASQLPKLDCPAEQLFFFHLKPLATQPPRASVKFPNDTDGLGTMTVPAAELSQIRLDVCLTTEELILERVIYRENGAMYYVADQKTTMMIQGLDQATQGQPGDLQVTAPYNFGFPETATAAMLLVGAKHDDQEFVAFTLAFKNEQGLYLPQDSTAILAGTLEMGDPFQDVKCGFGTYTTTERVVETLTVTTESCIGGGTSGTTGFTIIGMTVVDTHNGVAEEYRNKPFTVSGKDLETALEYKQNHHNDCDYFIFKTPFGTYSALVPVQTSREGCKVSNDLLPQQDESTMNRLLLKATYGNGHSWQAQLPEGIRHFAFGASNEGGIGL